MNPPSGDLRVWVEVRESFAASEGPHFLQSGYWAAHKERFGWSSRTFFVLWRQGNGSVPEPASFPLVVLLRTAVLGLTLAYVPHGPAWSGLSGLEPSLRGTFLELLGQALVAFLPSRTFLLRFDPDWPRLHGDDSSRGFGELKKGSSDIQPPDTVILNLRPELHEILTQCKSKHRYNIRLAQKKGIEVREVHLNRDLEPDQQSWEKEFGQWYGLYKETATRDKIAIHSYDYYYQGFLQFPLDDQRQIVLLQAYHEDDYLAGIVVIFWGSRATYVYGASSNQKRNLMPAYALQWRAIELAKATGCTEYDLFGIPPSNSPDHPMHGLYQFKTGFGGTIVHYPGTWDLVLHRAIYWFYRFLEGVRKLLVRLRKR
ncbi:MAG: peptidoglycan bridge formation glycyltransferase FemA/FemB family protein [Spirochaetales bacterium]|nr:peptidoglycan bridge formation glycyltransferase FemA/FemB family protein [Spirochaetales bacterium]